MVRRTRIIDSRARRNGFTLPEALIAAVVLAAAVVGIAGTLSASYQQTVGQGESSKAMELCRELMEEIASKPMDAPLGTTDQQGFKNGVTNRSNYDTVDDYDGYTDTTTTGGSTQQMTNYDGTAVDIGSGYTRKVTFLSGNYMPTGHTAPASDFTAVQVTVTTPHNMNVQTTQLLPRVTVQR
jgi:Tfp pilus assembly protein PilV